MAKKTFGLIGAGIFVGGALLIVFFFFVVSNSSSVEFTILSDGAMANLVGGSKYKWDGWHAGGYGEFADCTGKTPPCTPTQADPAEYHPDVYTCTNCYSGQKEYYKFYLYMTILSWCKDDGPSSCKYQSDAFDYTSDCEHQTGTTC